MSFTLDDLGKGRLPGGDSRSLSEVLQVIADVSRGFVDQAFYLHDVESWMPPEVTVHPDIDKMVILVTDAGRTLGAFRHDGDGLVECFRFDRHGDSSKKKLRGLLRYSHVQFSDQTPNGEILFCTLVHIPRDLNLTDPVRPGFQTSVRMPEDDESKPHFEAMRKWLTVIAQIQSVLGEDHHGGLVPESN